MPALWGGGMATTAKPKRLRRVAFTQLVDGPHDRHASATVHSGAMRPHARDDDVVRKSRKTCGGHGAKGKRKRERNKRHYLHAATRTVRTVNNEIDAGRATIVTRTYIPRRMSARYGLRWTGGVGPSATLEKRRDGKFG